MIIFFLRLCYLALLLYALLLWQDNEQQEMDATKNSDVQQQQQQNPHLSAWLNSEACPFGFQGGDWLLPRLMVI
ncbi:unnamed protein product [Dibothriocephalus latus]|uniref:Secreted protein n=1 Tax=Dibothriocephalus latus TaxID=60516 RepID=A0A3P7N183_DIBLA|nr:unnamed protein product [Dibothriocephalus latus]